MTTTVTATEALRVEGLTRCIDDRTMVDDVALQLAHGELLASGTADEIQNDQRVIDAYLGAH